MNRAVVKEFMETGATLFVTGGTSRNSACRKTTQHQHKRSDLCQAQKHVASGWQLLTKAGN